MSNPFETPQAFLDHLIGFGESVLKDTGSVMPMIDAVTALGEHLLISLVGLESGEDKDRALASVKLLFESKGVTQYGTILESWYVEVGPNEDTYTPPSKRSNRREALVAGVFDCTGTLAFTMRNIVRDEEGKPSLGPETTMMKAATFGGRFAELLVD